MYNRTVPSLVIVSAGQRETPIVPPRQTTKKSTDYGTSWRGGGANNIRNVYGFHTKLKKWTRAREGCTGKEESGLQEVEGQRSNRRGKFDGYGCVVPQGVDDCMLYGCSLGGGEGVEEEEEEVQCEVCKEGVSSSRVASHMVGHQRTRDTAAAIIKRQESLSKEIQAFRRDLHNLTSPSLQLE